MNTPVTFEIAKLLKDKGFDKLVRNYYSQIGHIHQVYNSAICENMNGSVDERVYPNLGCFSAPVIAEVVMWLCEKHGIWIGVDGDCYGVEWFANLSVVSKVLWEDLDRRANVLIASKKLNIHKTPTEAYNEAILYVLNNLI